MLTLDILRGALIVLLMLAFAGMVIWLWFITDRRRFDEVSRLPLDDGDATGRATRLGAQHHE